jgi:hypothetical protein
MCTALLFAEAAEVFAAMYLVSDLSLQKLELVHVFSAQFFLVIKILVEIFCYGRGKALSITLH